MNLVGVTCSNSLKRTNSDQSFLRNDKLDRKYYESGLFKMSQAVQTDGSCTVKQQDKCSSSAFLGKKKKYLCVSSLLCVVKGANLFSSLLKAVMSSFITSTGLCLQLKDKEMQSHFFHLPSAKLCLNQQDFQNLTDYLMVPVASRKKQFRALNALKMYSKDQQKRRGKKTVATGARRGM